MGLFDSNKKDCKAKMGSTLLSAWPTRQALQRQMSKHVSAMDVLKSSRVLPMISIAWRMRSQSETKMLSAQRASAGSSAQSTSSLPAHNTVRGVLLFLTKKQKPPLYIRGGFCYVRRYYDASSRSSAIACSTSV